MTAFRIKFQGPSVENGEIDVADLAPALLALGEVFSAANQALNRDRAESKLKVKATAHGSFEALLSLDVSFITDLLDVVSAHPDRITSAKDLMETILLGGTIVGGGTVGLFKALQVLRGHRPDASSHNDDGTTSITSGDTTIIVDNRTTVLLEDLHTREATEKFAKSALKKTGIAAVSFGDGFGDSAEGVFLTNNDVHAMSVPDPSDDETETITETREALLQIVSAQFVDGYLWRFTDGTNTFTASMEDTDFINRISKSEITLSKDDTLRCLIEETQSLAGSRLKTEAKILRVKDHRSGARQLKLF